MKRYEMQTQADSAILCATRLSAQEKEMIGFANLTAQERADLAAMMESLVNRLQRDADLR